MIAHNVRALALFIGHGAMLIGASESGTRTIQAMRERQDPAVFITGTHQGITLMTIFVAVFLLAALFSFSDEPKRYQKALLWLSLAAFFVELAIACRIWLIA
jgi:hypothetical protein